MLDVSKWKPLILEGTVLAIDPSSGSMKGKQQSYPGYAIFKEGALSESGIITMNGKLSIDKRLTALYDQLRLEWPNPPDVLIIEKIRGREAHDYLKWAVGTTIAAIRAKNLIEMPVTTWRSIAGKEHKKSDQNDAEAIGRAAVELARNPR